jgi:hypothetical protein
MGQLACRYATETLSTLKFANRAKHIKNSARVNEDLDQKSLLRKYERELKLLRRELDERTKNLVGLYKLKSSLSHSLKAPGFINLSSEKLVSKFAFKWVNLYRYSLVDKRALLQVDEQRKKAEVGGCTRCEFC